MLGLTENPHTLTHIYSDSHHPLEHKLSVINYNTEMIMCQTAHRPKRKNIGM